MIAIKGGKIITITNGVIDGGVILIDDGKIVEIGKNVDIPKDCEVLNAENHYITPGFIDAHSHLAMLGEPSLPATEDVNERVNPVTPFIRAIDAFNPEDPAIEKVREAGFTTIYTGPGSANVIGGTGVTIKLRGYTADDMAIPNGDHMKMALGENPKRVYGQEKNAMPRTRMGNAALIRKTLYNAKVYSDQLKLAENDPSKMPKPDFELDALVKVVRGEQKVRIHCHRADDIITAIRICEEYNLNYSLEHVTEGYKVKEVLAKKNVQCVIGPTLLGPSKHELWDLRYDNAAILSDAGLNICLSADTAGGTVWLPMHIGVLIKNGLSEEKAYEGVTINPARLLGLEDKIGSLEVGKDADIAIFDGFPFSNMTDCKLTMIDGVIYNNKL